MNNALSLLSDADLRALAAAVRSRRIAPPYLELQISRVLPAAVAGAVAAALCRLDATGFRPDQVLAVLELLEQDRTVARGTQAIIELVTSGPEAPGVTNRDTAVVVRELFAHAACSVMVVGYAVYQGQRVFEALAARMEEVPALDVEMYLEVPRPKGDTSPTAILVSRFAQRFRDSQWPANHRLPRVFYDPRSTEAEGSVRSSLHAKCIVVDGHRVFVSSANFTEAGQQRNIEVGLKIESAWLADRLTRHFRSLHSSGLVARAL